MLDIDSRSTDIRFSDSLLRLDVKVLAYNFTLVAPFFVISLTDELESLLRLELLRLEALLALVFLPTEEVWEAELIMVEARFIASGVNLSLIHPFGFPKSSDASPSSEHCASNGVKSKPFSLTTPTFFRQITS